MCSHEATTITSLETSFAAEINQVFARVQALHSKITAIESKMQNTPFGSSERTSLRYQRLAAYKNIEGELNSWIEMNAWVIGPEFINVLTEAGAEDGAGQEETRKLLVRTYEGALAMRQRARDTIEMYTELESEVYQIRESDV